MSDKINLLLVEDEPDIRIITELALALDPDIAVLSFADPASTLACLGAERPEIDVALLDLKLPGMSGIDLHLAIRAMPAYEDICAILVTASVMDINKSPPNAPGLIGIIAKPYDPSKLAAQVRTLLKENRHQSSEELHTEHARQSAEHRAGK
jgi:DNA-binding response OmpR family regulator